MANYFRLVCCCAIVAFTAAALSKESMNGFNWLGGRRNVYNSDVTWMMLTDSQGQPQLALLTRPGPEPPRTVNLTRDVHFILYTQSNPDDGYQLYIGNSSNLKNSPFKSRNPTKILIHGFTDHINAPVIQDIKNAYLSVGSYNVIGVDWGALCGPPMYTSAKNHVTPVGEFVGQMVDFLSSEGGQSPSEMHLIGHSLGAHVSGIAANISAGTVARITGLDAALPLYEDDADSGRLDPNDAAFVDVIHTCGGWLGFKETRGQVDFYPNGGVSAQPGCGLDLTGSCSHSKAVKYFVASITDHKLYPAHECGSVKDALEGKCDNSTSGYMGDGVSAKLKGIYWLSTK